MKKKVEGFTAVEICFIGQHNAGTFSVLLPLFNPVHSKPRNDRFFSI